MQDINEFIAALPNYNYREVVYNGAPMSLKALMGYVGIVLVARDSYPDMPIASSMLQIMRDAGFEPPMGGVLRPVGEAPPSGCSNCGGGKVR